MMHIGVTIPSMSFIIAEESQENSARPKLYNRETCIYLPLVGQMFTCKFISVSNFNRIDIYQVVSKIDRPDWWLCDVQMTGVGTATSRYGGIVIAVNSQTGVTELWGLPSGTALRHVH